MVDPHLYPSDSFFDIIVPFLNIKDIKFLYLRVFQHLINPYLGIFSNDISYFYHFPFKAKETLLKIKLSTSSNVRLNRFEQLSLHYWDALHLQFFCIMALAAKALGHIQTSMLCIRQARIYSTVLHDIAGQVMNYKSLFPRRLTRYFEPISLLGRKLCKVHNMIIKSCSCPKRFLEQKDIEILRKKNNCSCKKGDEILDKISSKQDVNKKSKSKVDSCEFFVQKVPLTTEDTNDSEKPAYCTPATCSCCIGGGVGGCGCCSGGYKCFLVYLYFVIFF
jgi:hypothetical protein